MENLYILQKHLSNLPPSFVRAVCSLLSSSFFLVIIKFPSAITRRLAAGNCWRLGLKHDVRAGFRQSCRFSPLSKASYWSISFKLVLRLLLLETCFSHIDGFFPLSWRMNSLGGPSTEINRTAHSFIGRVY